MKNKKINGLIIFIVTVIVLFLALKDDFLEKINYLFSFNMFWLVLGVLCVCLYWLGKSLVIYFCAQKFDKKYSLKKAFKLMLDTQFINAVTPFSVGGQPYLIYRFKKQGISIEKGTNIAIQDFIVYQISLILLGTIAIISNYFLGIFPPSSLLRKLVVLGYIINVAVIITLFIVAFNTKINKKLLNWAIKILSRLKLIKDKEGKLEQIDTYIYNFHQGATVLMKSKWHFFKIILINFVALVFLYLVPFTLIMGLSIDVNPFIVVVTSAYVMLIGSFVPIPGGTGGLEFGFVEFFGTYIIGAKLSSIMIMWRLLTYYFGLIVGAISINYKEE